MAGSFDLFRKYQRSMLAAVAILAMLAFFVLPPFLQMAPEAGAVDPLVATWNGGGIREGELQRTVAMGTIVNQFLRDAVRQATGRDPGEVRLLAEDERSAVRTLLLAREAEANGVVVGNAAVNRFLKEVTDDRLRGADIESLIQGRRLGTMSVSTMDVFAALRTFLAANQFQRLVANGLGGYPPGARWDVFRRLEQEATIEVVPVVVESLAAEVPTPAEADLLALYERRKDMLPVDRSPEPGFREPHRISFDWIVANRESLEAAAAKDVPDADVEKYYEENKARLYRAKQPAAGDAGAAEKPGDAPADKPAAEEFEPLDKVRDDIRKRLAADTVSTRIDSLFKAITTDVGGFARDIARWKADVADEASRPTPPNAAAIAEKQGLAAGHGEKRTAAEAEGEGGVGASFLVMLDPNAPMGFRQARWSDLFFAVDRLPWRPVETSDAEGNRYLTWKTDDMPSTVPEFKDIRADVERAWRIIAARPLAEAKAREIAAKAAGRPLAEAVADLGLSKLEVVGVEPFTWLSRGASFGGPASLSQPAGVEMPGEEFMEAVFALEPGGTAVAFNEPRTVCYVIRFVSAAPPEDDLRTRYADATADQRRLEAVAERDRERALAGWLDGVERRAGLEWTTPPQGR